MANIRLIKPGDNKKLADLFSIISRDEIIKKFFHPHPLTKEHAEKICQEANKRKDLYFIAINNNEATGYAMLRGWDEGYDIPSFGICVHPSYQGRGTGKELTNYAIKLCKEKKSKKMMFKVYKDNLIACELYKKIGVDFKGETHDKKQWIGYLNLK